MFKRGKKAQIYLIAAIIIIAVIFGVVGLKNYIIAPQETVKVYDLSKELDLEGESVVNYGIYNENETIPLLQDFSEKYSSYVDPETELLFIYGNKEEFEATTYLEATTGEIIIVVGQNTNRINIQDKVARHYELGKPIGTGENKVNATIGNYTYDFKLHEGENFFFIVKSKGYVARTKTEE